jgi:hypothetical protein
LPSEPEASFSLLFLEIGLTALLVAVLDHLLGDALAA